MNSIWICQIEFHPAGPMTFRIMPSGILHIMSYPFMPPTTMSGFLKRLIEIAEGREWPVYGDHWFNGPKGKEFTLTLGKEYRALGAFPEPDKWSIHKTRRHGPKVFDHVNFSKLLRLDKDEPKAEKKNYQLHHWDYLLCESLAGWVVAADRKALKRLDQLKNYGGKVGKEGYLIVKTIGEIRELPLKRGDFKPLGLVTPPFRPLSGTFYNLYGHHWSDEYEWQNGETGGVDGYFQLGGWWNADSVNGPYWEWESGIGFPKNTPDAFLQGDVQPLYNGDES